MPARVGINSQSVSAGQVLEHVIEYHAVADSLAVEDAYDVVSFASEYLCVLFGNDYSVLIHFVAVSCNNVGFCPWIKRYDRTSVCDCFISTMDTIGHITDVKALSKMFASVSGLLEEGGVFILDTTTKHHFEETLGNNVFYEDYDDFTLLWVNHYDKESRINHAELTLFELTDEDLYERYDGELTARCYFREEIEKMAEMAGLKTFAVFGDLNRETPSESDERLFYVFGK